MRSELTLRARFLLAMLAVVTLLCVTFGLTVHQFVEILEDEMLHRTLAREMQDFAGDFTKNPRRPPPSAGGLSGYVVRDGLDAAGLPSGLAALSAGLHEDVRIQGNTYYVARQDVPGARLYLLLDTQHVESIERGVTTVAVAGGLVALALAALVATLLARAVLRPVTALANEVAALDPRRRGSRLHGHFADREVGVIASAFDDYVARLEQVLEREQAFSEDASHELRTPLSIISSAAELLAEEPGLSAAGRERNQRIRRACREMHALIEALLFLAREEGSSAQPCALDEIVREAVDGARALVEGRGVGLDVHIEPVVLSVSPGMAVCVIGNLLLNAVNFTRQGLIEVKLTPAGLVVRDTGAGIAPADLSHIFERRYRGPQSRGLGLGLYLVSRICERLGWRIQADSAPGVGTRFTITFTSGERT
jgi:signal transduction histidine kinase